MTIIERIESIRNAVAIHRNGTYSRITYNSELPVSAVAKKSGIRIVKQATTTVRFGVNYGHLKSVIDTNKDNSKNFNRANPYEWIVKNIIKRNVNNGNSYLQCITTPNNNTKVEYKIMYDSGIKRSIDYDSLKNYVIGSYFNNKECSIFNVNIDNIISINGVNI